MTKKSITYILILIALTAIVSMAGCAAPAQEHKDTLTGKDVFNPSTFSMATYITEGNQSTGQLKLLSYTGEEDGDRLASVEVADGVSRRMDVWLDRARDSVNKATMTVIDQSGMQVVEMPEAFNMTTMDRTWNTPGATYAYYGNDTAIVPAGKYANCSVYYGEKHIQFEGGSLNLTVVYYMHPSSPVPVLYMVKSTDGIITYALQSVYGPDDIDSSPERAAQSYFDRIGTGDYAKAARLLVKAEGSSLKPMDRASIAEMEKNMEQTYGEAGEKMGIQYVITDAPRSTGTIGGHEAVTMHWSSIHYSRTPGQVYSIDGSFNMVNDGGWKIIV
jgi:hypothetical protein